MTRRTDRRAACHREPLPRTTPCSAALRSEAHELRRRIEGLWSAALIGEELTVEEIHAIALSLSTLRLRIEATTPAWPGAVAGNGDVAAARDDVACCVVAVSDLVAYFAAA